MHEVISQVCDEFPYHGVFWDRFVDQLTAGLLNPDNTGQKGLFLRFLEYETIHDIGLKPAMFESTFGATRISNESIHVLSDDRLKIQSVIDNTPVLVQGKIDRIDVVPDPTNPELMQYLVIDYKTGRYVPRYTNEIKRGLSFQLPIYVRAVKYFKEKETTRPRGGSYYFVPLDDEIIASNTFVSEKLAGRKGYAFRDFEPYVEDMLNNRISRIVYSIHGGFFPPSLIEDRNRCGFCDYKNLCRISGDKMDSMRVKVTSMDPNYFLPDPKPGKNSTQK
jgi:hypothetical protein